MNQGFPIRLAKSNQALAIYSRNVDLHELTEKQGQSITQFCASWFQIIGKFRNPHVHVIGVK